MKKSLVSISSWLIALWLLVGCHQSPTPDTMVSELEKAFPATAAETGGAASAVSNPTPSAAVDALVQTALTAARANDYAGGVIALQTAQERPGITANQVEVVQRAKQALIADLQRRAGNGDQQALAQLKAIERTRSQ